MSAAARHDRPRLFFALWPDAQVRDALAAVARGVQAECGGRAIKPEKVHLTLFFIGNIGRERIAHIQNVASAVHAAPFELMLDRLGYFRYNRIAWAGASACPARLATIAAQLHEGLAREGFDGEDRPFVPHVTLVRDARRRPSARAFPPIVWRAEHFALVESVTSAAASQYDVIERWRL